MELMSVKNSETTWHHQHTNVSLHHHACMIYCLQIANDEKARKNILNMCNGNIVDFEVEQYDIR